MAHGAGHAVPPPQFPTHNAPRVWLLTSGDSPVGISLTRQILDHGDYVVLGIDQTQFEAESDEAGPLGHNFRSFLAEVGRRHVGWKERMKVIGLDVRNVSSCQAAVGVAVATFGRVDILLCCSSQAIIGAVEELGHSPWARALVRDQFESNFFGPVNIVKAVLPAMRAKLNGHLVVLTGIYGHLGTPGLGAYCAAGWALEGFCDSIAYEVAPFNVKVTVVQASIEIGLLTNKITSVPPMPEYSPESGNTAPLFRNILDGLLNRLPRVRAQHPPLLSPTTVAAAGDDVMVTTTTTNITTPQSTTAATVTGIPTPSASEYERQTGPYLLSSGGSSKENNNEVVSLYPPLSPAHVEKLVAETVHALTAIGGHENPPGRHIVGVEGVASVKEKLKTVSEELEEFVDSSVAVDIKPSNTSSGGTGTGTAATTATTGHNVVMTSHHHHHRPSSSLPSHPYSHPDVHADVYDAVMVLQSI